MTLEHSTQLSETTMPRRLNWEALAVFLILPILLLGAYFRINGLNWDNFSHLHPDERFLTDVGSLLSPVENPLDYLRTSVSTLNPYNFGKSFYVYGNFPMTVTEYAAQWMNDICATLAGSDDIPPAWCSRDYTGYDGIHLVGRFLAALVDLVAVLLTFMIGRRLYSTSAGLLAALLMALAVMPIQQSHFFTMDTWASALTTLAIYAAVRAAAIGDSPQSPISNLQSPGLNSSLATLHSPPPWRLRWFVLFGLALGLAMATRVNVAPLGLVIGLSAIIWLAQRGHTFSTLLPNLSHPDLQRMILSGIVAVFVTVLTFRLAQPYAFTDSELARQQALAETGNMPNVLVSAVRSVIGFNPQWLSNMAEIQRQQSPEANFPPAKQWVSRAPILFPLTNMILHGMGMTAGLFAWFCVLWALWRIVRRRASWNGYPEWMLHAIPLFWTLLYFLFMGTRWVKSIRYFLPIYPTLFILAGWGLVFLWRWADRSRGAGEQRSRGDLETGRLGQRVAVLVLAIMIILPSLLWANAFTEIYRQPLTRIAASDWIFENVPSGLTLLYEDENGQSQALQLPVKMFFFEAGGVPLLLDFTMPESGVVTGVRFNYLNDPDGDTADEGESLRVQLNDGPEAELALSLGRDFEAATLELPPMVVTAGQAIHLVAQAGSGGPIRARTSLLMNEEWDDLLPVSTQGRNAYGGYYTEVTGGQRPVTVPDRPEKLPQVTAWLDEADYLMVSSQRAMWSLPRIPLSYPLMIRYYESLFNGELGFDLVAQFHGDIHIGSLYISDTGGRLGWGELPQIGWPPPGDLAAEEAFSVYDHPPVWIFAKTDRYSPENTMRVLGSIDLTQVLDMNPLEATRARNGLMLSESAMLAQRLGGTFSKLFDMNGPLATQPALAAVVWWLAIILLGWLAFPLTFIALPGLADRGYGLSRILGMLLLSYIPWLLASLNILPHTRASLLLALLLIVAGSFIVLIRRGSEISAFVRQNLAYIGLVELVGVAFYLLMIGIRLGNPDVWDVIWGGEKPMDLSYFTAVLKSSTFPPYDPWFAGGYINYYYYGFVFVGALTKLLGILPSIAYNLILPMLFSFTALGIFTLAYNLVIGRQQSGEWRVASDGWRVQNEGASSRVLNLSSFRRAIVAGLIAASLAVLLGNLAQLGVTVHAWRLTGSESLERVPLVGGLARTIDGGIKVIGGQPAPIYPGDWFWNASRAINYNEGEVAPITEFPYFTFLYGDLHAHMISMPLTLLALGWAISLALQPSIVTTSVVAGNKPGTASGRQRLKPLLQTNWVETGWQWLVGGLVIGSLRATNTWDWPTYLVIGGLAVMFFVYRRYQRIDLRSVGAAVLLIAALFGLSVLTFWPFAANYGTGYSSASLWPGSYTYLSNYLVIYGLFLFLAVSYLVVEFRAWTATWTSAQLRRLEPAGRLILAAVALYLIILIILFLRSYWIAPLVLTLIVAAGLLGLRPNISAAQRVVLILLACALGLTLVVEIFVLDGDIGRMNTVFKFYMQVWLLLSIIGGVAAVWAWPVIRRKSSLRLAWSIVLGVLVFIAALYPLTATKAKWDIRMSKDAPHTLDGMAFIPYASYGDTDYAGNGLTIQLGDDYEAIQWLQNEVEGSPVIVEAHSSNPYRSIANRVVMYTGLPTIVGWDWHQRQQRTVTPGQLVSSRIEDVNLLYRTPDITQARTILEKYDVEYIYVGSLERAYYHPDGLAKFEQMVSEGYLTIAYQDQHATIYRVNQDASQQALR